MIKDLRLGQSEAMSLKSKPLHWILSPLSWVPTSSRQWTIFSTMMFSRVRKPSRGQCLKTPGLRLRGLLLPRNIVSKLGQQLAIMRSINKKESWSRSVSQRQDSRLTDGGKFLVRWSAVEYLSKLGVSLLLVPEHLFESGGGEYEVAQAVDVRTGLQHNARPVTFHLTSSRRVSTEPSQTQPSPPWCFLISISVKCWPEEVSPSLRCPRCRSGEPREKSSVDRENCPCN